MAYVIGFDLGTSSLKGILMNKMGVVIDTLSYSYPILMPKTGFSEQNPEEWINACQRIIRQLIEKYPNLKQDLMGISFSGQMHSLVVLNKNKEILRNAILWNDVRTTVQCKQIQELLGDRLIEITQNKPLEGFTLPKLLWLQENEPMIWEQVRHIMLPKDYLRFWLTGHIATDYSDAAGTLLMGLKGKAWSLPLLDLFKVPQDYLPEIKKSTDMAGKMRKELKEAFGLTHDIMIYTGGADNACSAIGAGILNSETAMVSIGTSGVFLSYEAEAEVEYKGTLHLFNHAVDDAFYSMGVTLSAGRSLDWFKNTFAKEASFEELTSQITDVEPGANGLFFTPYIAGERTPYADSTIRGSFIGIDASHTLKYFTRAVMEGITFSLKDSQMLMQTIANKSFKKIISTGGGARNPNWLHMQADIFDSPIVCLKTEQGPGFGAAMLAAIGLGWYRSIEECAKQIVHYTEPIFPNPKNVSIYTPIYEHYRAIYPAIHSLSSYQKIK